MTVLITKEDLSRILGGEPRFDLAAGPATRALLAKHVSEALKEQLGTADHKAVVLLRQAPGDWLEGMDRLADFNSQGVTGACLVRLASEERSAG